MYDASADDHFLLGKINGVMICRRREFIGSLTVMDFAKAKKKGRMNASVKGYAKRSVPMLSPDDAGHEALDLMNKIQEPVLAVVENGELTGVVTHGDLMLHIYEF